MTAPDITIFNELITSYTGELVYEKVYAGIIKPYPVKIYAGVYMFKNSMDHWACRHVRYWIPGPYQKKYKKLQELLDTIPQMTIEK